MIICLLWLCGLVGALQKAGALHSKTIIEDNHYYSSTEKLTNYEVKNVEKGKALILILKHSHSKTNKLMNQLMITLHISSDSTPCYFTRLTDLCIVPKVQDTNLQMKI